MKYFSMFSGIGGFEYGIQNCPASWRQGKDGGEGLERNRDCSITSSVSWEQVPTCVGFSEIDKYAKQIYLKHFKEHKDYGDCTKIDWTSVENFDCLVGGFPCQAFSIAGKRAGFSDTRGTLFFEIARCLKEKQPRICVLENVKGLLSHDKGATFFTILTTLDELGYDCQWQVLNSKNFGVPQNRERVFIIGHLRGTGRPEVFPIGENDGISYEKIESEERQPQAEISSTIRPDIGQKADCTFVKSIKANHLSQNGRNEHEDGYAFTITQDQNDSCVGDGIRIRRLTPTECERLQGFPDGWTEGISDTQRYKCLGNAVTTNVITAIFNLIIGEDNG